MKYLNKLSIFSLLTLGIFSSCTKEKPEIEFTPTYKMSGEWFVKTYHGGATVLDYEKISTYNTSDPNASQVWVDDLEHIWPFKAKFEVNYSAQTFNAMTAAANVAAGQTGTTIKVLEGKVLSGMGRTKSGNTSDSIYLKLEFSDDPGEVYEIRGHQRTGFFEDEF